MIFRSYVTRVVVIFVAVFFVALVVGYQLRDTGAGTQQGERVQVDSGYTSITPAAYVSLIAEEDVTVVDVHIPEQSHIPGTDLVIAYDQIAESEKLPAEKDAKIVVYCRSGSMSREAANTLVDMGYSNVYDLSGGKNAFDAYQIGQAKQQVQEAQTKADFIDFEAVVVSESYLPVLKQELGASHEQLDIDMEKTNIMLYANNHRIDLGQFDYRAGATLDGQSALAWQALSSQIGGHHIAGLLTFEPTTQLEQLTITGLPSSDAVLDFSSTL